MFQNGLLATFIPEFIMVVGYVLCLLAPSFNPQNSTTHQASVNVQVVNYEQQQSSVYQLSTFDFRTITAVDSEIKPSLPRYVKTTVFISYVSSFLLSNGLSFIDFSRPPPSLIF